LRSEEAETGEAEAADGALIPPTFGDGRRSTLNTYMSLSDAETRGKIPNDLLEELECKQQSEELPQ
jgi:hypothetical protein